jgi:TPR repeat protein
VRLKLVRKEANLENIALENAIAAFDSGDCTKELFDKFVELIDLGVKEANYFVACMYEDGTNGVPTNFEHAFFYYKQSVDELSYLEGYLALARMYYHGTGTKQDFGKAHEYYSHVAEQNRHLVACFMLGRMYQYGQGVEMDCEKARFWYARSISQGSIYGMINLSLLETQRGKIFKGLSHRIKAAIWATIIAWKNPRDTRLRGG